MECGINIHSQRIELVLHACNKSCFTSALSLNNNLMSIEYVFQRKFDAITRHEFFEANMFIMIYCYQ